MSLRSIAAIVVSAQLVCGCANECVDDLPATCAPLYQPEYPEVFARTLQRTCSQRGGTCHAADGAKGDLILDDADVAYLALTAPKTGTARVIANDAACSPLIVRLESSDADEMMPPGKPLGAEERCAIRQWIDRGAPRD